MPWPLDDPSPDEDMQSDITFGAWLEGLDPIEVLYDYERSIYSAVERAHIRYLRRQIERRNQDL